jgi:Domain of unknown function (DUF4282)
MPDRPPSHPLPDDWSHGSYSARESFPDGGAADAHGAGTAGAQEATAAETYGTAAAAAYHTGNADSVRTTAADPFGDADRYANANLFGEGGLFGPVAADGYGAAADGYGAAAADGYGAAAADGYGAAAAEAATAPADGGSPAAPIGEFAPGEAAGARGFLSALFDFGFTSFVTPKVIKVLYTLTMIGAVVSALVFTVIVFKASTAFGIVTLLLADPLFILVVMGIYRVVLEFFVVAFRAAEDIRVLRERSERGL